MKLLQRSRKAVVSVLVSLILAIATFGLFPSTPAMAAPMLVAENDMTNTTTLERRVKATGDEIGGRTQKEFGRAVDSPGNQIEGSLREASGSARNQAEDLGDRVKDAARDAENSAETLVDRVKDFFD